MGRARSPANDQWFRERIEILAVRVRRRREDLGLSVHDLAGRAAVAASTIYMIEAGLPDDIYASTLLALSRALHVTPDYLWGLDRDAHLHGMVKVTLD